MLKTVITRSVVRPSATLYTINGVLWSNNQYSVLYALWTGGSSLSLGLGQPWPCLDPFPLLARPIGIAFHLQLVLLSYHPIFLCPYDFLKLVSFLGANRTKSASVCPWLSRGTI